jgi:hypothetical protein
LSSEVFPDKQTARDEKGIDVDRSIGGTTEAVRGQAALMDKNRTGPGENFVQKDDFEVQREALWRWAADRVTPWGKVQKDDYDFRWTNGAAKQHMLEAGCIYEYARESRKLRGLLVLMNPGREREPFETMALSRTGRLNNLPCSFEGLREEDARRALGGALRWLRGYAGELVENKSFAHLLRTRQKELIKFITERPLHFPLKAVQLAFTFPLWDARRCRHSYALRSIHYDASRGAWGSPDPHISGWTLQSGWCSPFRYCPCFHCERVHYCL